MTYTDPDQEFEVERVGDGGDAAAPALDGRRVHGRTAFMIDADIAIYATRFDERVPAELREHGAAGVGPSMLAHSGLLQGVSADGSRAFGVDDVRAVK